MLILEQGRTIEAQRSLILSLFDDSTQLSRLRSQAVKQHAEAQAQAEAKAHPQSQTPQDKLQDPAKKGSHSGKLHKPAPQKPPTDAATSEDERRNVVVI